MRKPELVVGLSDTERHLVIEALRALRRERGKAWNDASDIAEKTGQTSPPLEDYGIGDIEWLAHRFGGSAHHWSEE